MVSVAITEEDALKLLEIKKGASIEEISQAYKRASLKAHPDKGGTSAQFQLVTEAKEKLFDVAKNNGTAANSQVVSEKEDIKNVIVQDDSFLVSLYEDEFREWRKPNMKIMGRLNANNKNKETEMVLDYCSKGTGGSFQGIEKYLRQEVGISSPYHMSDRVLAIKNIIESFRLHLKATGKI